MLHARRWFTNEIPYADAPWTLLLIATASRTSCHAKTGIPRRSLFGMTGVVAVSNNLLKLFDGEICIGINADFAGDAHRFHGQVFGGQLGMFQHRSRGSQSIAPAGTNGHNPVVRLDDIAVAGKDEGSFTVGHNEHGFEVTQRAVLA